MTEQVTTLTFFSYDSFTGRFWAFTQMQFAHAHLRNVPGQHWYKLLGSGKGKGFNPWPDWSTYSLLQVWDTERALESYINAESFRRFLKRAGSVEMYLLNPLSAKGKWDGSNPFITSEKREADTPLAVLTRATIRYRELIPFWSYVPRSQEGLFDSEHLLFTKGIGEVPFRQMATFSVWSSETAIGNFD